MSRREFHLVQGTSRKFWTIELDGAAHSTTSGRMGTPGLSYRKEFPSEAEARASHNRLIRHKLEKGYREVTGAAATPPHPAPAPLSAAVSIDLGPDDWLWATWRPRSPRPRPEPPPFDLDECLNRLVAVRRRGKHGQFHWSKARLAAIMSAEEARFWIIAMTEARRRDLAPVIFLDELQSRCEAAGRDVATDEAVRLLRDAVPHVPVELLEFAVNLFPPREFVRVVRDVWGLEWDPRVVINEHVVGWFRRHVLPYLDGAEYRAMQDELRESLGAPSLPPNAYTPFPLGVYLAAALGLHEEVHRLVRSIPDDLYASGRHSDYCHHPQLLVMGLGDPSVVDSEIRRLKLRLKSPDDIRGWIAHTEDRSLDLVRDSILAIGKKPDCQALIEVLARVQSPRTAAPMLEVMVGSKAPAAARRWLDEHPGHAIPGLIPLAAGEGPLAEAAGDYLRAQDRKGCGGYIRTCLAAAPPETIEKFRCDVLERAEDVIPALDDATTPAWLRAACDEARSLEPPGWVGPAPLRPILVEGRRLNPGQVTTVLAALAGSAIGAPHPMVAALKAHADRRSLDTFAWALFDDWVFEGAPASEKWAMTALGLLGSDAVALKLAPMVRAWPGESRHARAVHGLECLRAIGTDAALMQLNGIAQTLGFRALKARATEMMQAIAADHGLSRDELEDRIIPDCGLDECGGRTFDFGPRQFRFALGPDLKPMVRDEAGQFHDDLPRPGPQDDADKAAAAVEAWRQVRKQVRVVARVQAGRLERAMATGRRWTPGGFESLLVRHPLMIHLVCRLLWGGYDERGRLVATFRVTEECEFADIDGSTCRLECLAAVGVVHPLQLNDEQRSAWGEIFRDRGINPPFAQLGRL
jgi:predicted DNA-binding WGR domain protein